MTEAEAKLKWCPFVRAGVYGEGGAAISTVSVNRDPRYVPSDLSPCIASGCMAWRWSQVPVMNSQPEGSGYCGLAGKPT